MFESQRAHFIKMAKKKKRSKAKKARKTTGKTIARKRKALPPVPRPIIIGREPTMKKPLLILTTIFAIIAVLLALLITISLLVTERPFFEEKTEEKPEKVAVPPIEFVPKQPLFNATQAIMHLPAVDNQGEGVMTLLVVEAIPGSGRTLVDIDSLLFWADTQHSIRIAKNVAANLSAVDMNNYDLVYNIYANASVIGGESAGAAITIATMAVLLNKTVREDVVITGTINHDGTIGPVEAILPKAEAAKAINASMLIVPLLQSREVVYEIREHCEYFGQTEVCTTEKVPRKVNITEEVGIDVIEAETIQEAMKYFFE